MLVKGDVVVQICECLEGQIQWESWGSRINKRG
jgi:hypothetical protein